MVPTTRLSMSLPLVLVGPPVVTDAGAREVDHRVDLGECGRIEPAGRGIPRDLVGSSGATHDRDGDVTGGGEVCAECRADES